MNTRLMLDPNTPDPDGVYQMIIDMHKDLSEDESHAVNARMILILANHIGDKSIIAEATGVARENMLKCRHNNP